MSMNVNAATLMLPAGTIVHICGWAVELTKDTEVEGDKANIELVTRDLYLRKQTPLGSEPGAAMGAK